MILVKRNFIITSVFTILILIVSVFVFEFGYEIKFQKYKETPVAKEGVLDLSTIDFSKNKLIKLKGEVEFYYQQLLFPRELNDSIADNLSGYQSIHGVWNDFILDGEPINGKGFATYHFKIIVPKDELYGFKIKEFDCAYNIFINGFGPLSAGIVADNANDYSPSWKRNELYIPSRNKELDVVIQIANFSHRKGGPEDVIIFGKGRDILKYKSTQLAIGYFLLGVLIIMIIYHLVLFFYRPKDKSILYFSLLNLSMTFRLLTTGEKLFLDLFPNVSWLFAIRVEYISYTLAVPFFLIFIYSFYPHEVKRIFVLVINWIAAAFSIITLAFPAYIFSYTPIYYQIVVVICALYILFILIKAAVKKLEHAFVLFGGYLFFFVVVINDLLYYNKFLNTSFLMPLGVFVLIFSQAFVLSRKTSKAFTDVEKLSSTLDKYNKELEEMVDERVLEVRNQKNEIEEQQEILINQAEELKQINHKLVDLNKFKENMTHMIVHDLKNPLNVILNQAQDGIVTLAGKQMLNLVENILDVQKYEETKMELKLEKKSITLLVDNSLEQVKILLDKKEVNLINNINTKSVFEFDYALIRRVVINLLSNAVSYVPVKGSVRLDYRIEGELFIIEIYNSGPTIPEEEKDYIFSKYGHDKGKRSFFNASTGLGLTFCKMAIDAHKGKIGYYNRKEKGVTFWFSLPMGEKEKEGFDQNISFLKKRNTKQVIEPDLSQILSISDKLYLNSIKEDLKELEIFEISKFKSVLKRVNHSYSVGVYVWIESIQKALQTIDEERLKKLLNLLE